MGIFDEYAQQYDAWFDKNKDNYNSEIQALKQAIPPYGVGIEIGVGTGRFSVPFSINLGVEPSQIMAKRAQNRGITVFQANAESLPFVDVSFDFVLMVTTICFLQDIDIAFNEATRVLKPKGRFIIGMIDKDSTLGKIYESQKNKSPFYRYAHFYSVDQIIKKLRNVSYKHVDTYQTLFKTLKDIKKVEPIKQGYGNGGFVVISAQKEV